MIKYGDLVQYIKDNHVNWNTDLFDVLRDFFNQYSPHQHSPASPIQQQFIFHNETQSNLPDNIPFPSNLPDTNNMEFEEPKGGEYTSQDLMNLFSI